MVGAQWTCSLLIQSHGVADESRRRHYLVVRRPLAVSFSIHIPGPSGSSYSVYFL